jgi:membrane protease YdiL (CAAX protease family)
MIKVMNNLENNILIFKNINKNYLLISMIIINLIFVFFISLSVTLLINDEIFEVDYLIGQSLPDIFFTTVIFAPIIETLIFQFLIIESVLYLFKKLKISNSLFVSVAISGIFFGISHSYNIYYVLVTILLGFLLGFFYLIAKNHKYMNAFLTVCIVHSCSNLVGFIVDDWLGLM